MLASAMRRIAALIVSLLLTGAALAERPVRSLLEMRQENVVIQRWDNSCGAAALATILTYDKDFPISEERVAQGLLRQTDPLRVQHRGGFSLLDMKRYAAQIGFDSDGYSDMTLDDLASQVPMIVPIRARGYDHFVVVRRVTDEDVLVADPGFGNYHMRRARFAALWSGIGFLVGQHTGHP
jgi:predicted double-glycine peptidase